MLFIDKTLCFVILITLFVGVVRPRCHPLLQPQMVEVCDDGFFAGVILFGVVVGVEHLELLPGLDVRLPALVLDLGEDLLVRVDLLPFSLHLDFCLFCVCSARCLRLLCTSSRSRIFLSLPLSIS